MSQEGCELSIVVPSYKREQVLINTIRALLQITTQESEIILVDQTPNHESQVQVQLEEWGRAGIIKWIRQSQPSIPVAMNRGALEARGRYLLFVDDDIEPDSSLTTAHLDAHLDDKGDLIVGRVHQPWHSDEECEETFTELTGKLTTQFIGCNFSISRKLLFTLGGFDEQFKGAAYSYEREIADRLLLAGYRIWYEPSARIRHLHHGSGGTRSKGDHLTSWNPRHPVGAYYYLLISPSVRSPVWQSAKRFLKSVVTRHHLKAPWYIPVTLTSEIFGFCWAIYLRMKGPSLPFKVQLPKSPIR